MRQKAESKSGLRAIYLKRVSVADLITSLPFGPSRPLLGVTVSVYRSLFTVLCLLRSIAAVMSHLAFSKQCRKRYIGHAYGLIVVGSRIQCRDNRRRKLLWIVAILKMHAAIVSA